MDTHVEDNCIEHSAGYNIIVLRSGWIVYISIVDWLQPGHVQIQHIKMRIWQFKKVWLKYVGLV